MRIVYFADEQRSGVQDRQHMVLDARKQTGAAK